MKDHIVGRLTSFGVNPWVRCASGNVSKLRHSLGSFLKVSQRASSLPGCFLRAFQKYSWHCHRFSFSLSCALSYHLSSFISLTKIRFVLQTGSVPSPLHILTHSAIVRLIPERQIFFCNFSTISVKFFSRYFHQRVSPHLLSVTGSR